jgi:DNA-binding LytR/AlgR family response regulator
MKNEEEFFLYKSKIESLDPSDVSYNYNMAVLNKVLNQPEKSIYYLEKTFEDKMMRLAFVHYDVFWEEYREIPQFKSLIARSYGFIDKKVVQLSTDTKETLKLHIPDFIYAEAQDNYTLLCIRKENGTQNTILRATLSNIENQLAETEVIRCHRSYLVNKNAGFQFCRENNKACLKHKDLNIRIPISRSKEKEVKHMIRQ